MAKLHINSDKSQHLDLKSSKLMSNNISDSYGIDLFENLVLEIKELLEEVNGNKIKIDNPFVITRGWAISTLEDFFKELNLKLHYSEDTSLYPTLHVKASLRKGIAYASKKDAMHDFSKALNNHIFDLEVPAPESALQLNSLFKEQSVLQDFCKEIVKRVQDLKVPKTTLINIKAPYYLISPVEFALNKAGWGCVIEGTLSISAVSSTYFRNINKIRNNLPEKGKGINFYQLFEKLSVEEVLFLATSDYTSRFVKKVQEAPIPVLAEVPTLSSVITEEPQPTEQNVPALAPGLKVAALTDAPSIDFSMLSPSKPSLTVHVEDVIAQPTAFKTSEVEDKLLNEVSVPNGDTTEFPAIEEAALVIPPVDEAPTAEKPQLVLQAQLAPKKTARTSSKPVSGSLVEGLAKKEKVPKVKVYNSTLPFGKVIELLKDLGLTISANELKREIPVPVLNLANSIINDKQLEYRKVHSFLTLKSKELQVPNPDLLDSLVIFTRALSAKILDEEIIEGFGVDITTIKEVREIIYA